MEAPVRVVGPATTMGLVSDIDDTVMETMVPRPLLAFRNAFLSRESARRTVPGMSELAAEIVRSHPDVFVVYLSTGAWNVAPALQAFLARHGFPRGPMLLTDWGPTEAGFFRSGQGHKRRPAAAALRRAAPSCAGSCWGTTASTTRRCTPRPRASTRTGSWPSRSGSSAPPSTWWSTGPPPHPTARRRVRRGPADGAVTVTAPDGFGLRDALRRHGISCVELGPRGR